MNFKETTNMLNDINQVVYGVRPYETDQERFIREDPECDIVLGKYKPNDR